MSSGVSATSSVSYSYATSSARRNREGEEAFSIPESALRTGQTGKNQQTPAPRDPAADSVELSRAYPQLVVPQTYSPPQPQQIRQVAGLADEASAKANLDRRGDEAIGAATNYAVEEDHAIPGGEEEPEDPAQAASDEADEAGKGKGEDLSEEEQQQVKELADRDREVRAHEQAHQAVGGQYAGGASYEYQQGPDGQRYAVGGEVSIDVSAERDPEATIAKMQQVKAAAMAPAEPSGQDRSVAAAATATEAQARAEMAEQSSAASGAEQSNGEEGGEEETETNAAQSSGAAGGTATMSSNPYGERGQQSRANPYQSVASVPGVFNLPNSYRAIDIVA